MALTLKLTQGAISADGLTFTVSDSTGNYNVSTNPGGYGSANTARESLGLKLVVTNKRFDGEDDLTDNECEIESYDPTDVTQWTVNTLKSGWYQVTIFGLHRIDTTPGAANSTSHAIGEIIMSDASDDIYRITGKVSVPGNEWEYELVEATDADLLNDEYTTEANSVYNWLITYELDRCLYFANKKYFQTYDKEDFDKYLDVDARLKAINYDFGFGNYAEAQKIVESLDNICENCIIE